VLDDRRVPLRAGVSSLLGPLVLLALAAAPAGAAQEPPRGTIVRAVDGDTLEVRLTDGRRVRVRLIGVDAPEVGGSGQAAECGGAQAAAVAARHAGQAVELTADPTQDARDRFGRVLAYADTDAGPDVGREVIEAGWGRAYVYDGRPFERLPGYRDAEAEAREARRGVWAACGGSFDRPAPGPGTAPPAPGAGAGDAAQTAERHVRRFYFLLNEGKHRRAWALLSAGLRVRFGPYAAWRAGCRRTLGTRVNRVDVSLVPDGRALAAVRIRSRDRDACTGRVVRRFFRVSWTLARRGGGWVSTDVSARKVGGGRVRTAGAECPRAVAPAPPPPSGGGGDDGNGGSGPGCHPSYDPCIPDDRDYDCGELSDGPYRVTGDDPYRLDGDGDGIGCE